jgi:tRNA A-37 threonylcarbamoyl transferase component Bud32
MQIEKQNTYKMMEQIKEQILKEKLKKNPNFSLIRKLQQLIDKVKN